MRKTHFSRGISNKLSKFPRINDFQMGECFSLLIEHEGRTILVHGSAGFIPGALQNVKADVVFIGIGGLGNQPKNFLENYWTEVVQATGAKLVVPIHWDNFFIPLEQPLTPIPWPLDDFNASLRFLKATGEKKNVDVRLPNLWQSSDPFTQLRGE